MAVPEETDWREVEAVEHTTHRPQIPELLTAVMGELVIDILPVLLLYLQALRVSRAHLGPVALGLLDQGQTDHLGQGQVYVLVELEEPEEAVEAVEQDLPLLAEQAEEERSFCTGRSKSLCMVIF